MGYASGGNRLLVLPQLPTLPAMTLAQRHSEINSFLTNTPKLLILRLNRVPSNDGPIAVPYLRVQSGK